MSIRKVKGKPIALAPSLFKHQSSRMFRERVEGKNESGKIQRDSAAGARSRTAASRSRPVRRPQPFFPSTLPVFAGSIPPLLDWKIEARQVPQELRLWLRLFALIEMLRSSRSPTRAHPGVEL